MLCVHSSIRTRSCIMQQATKQHCTQRASRSELVWCKRTCNSPLPSTSPHHDTMPQYIFPHMAKTEAPTLQQCLFHPNNDMCVVATPIVMTTRVPTPHPPHVHMYPPKHTGCSSMNSTSSPLLMTTGVVDSVARPFKQRDTWNDT